MMVITTLGCQFPAFSFFGGLDSASMVERFARKRFAFE